MTTTLVPRYSLQVRFSRKPANFRAMLRELGGHYIQPEWVWVIERKTMTPSEYRAFERDFTQPQDWIVPRNFGPCHCIMVEAPGMPTLYVRPEGYDYARYVGLRVGEA